MPLTDAEVQRIRYELGFPNLNTAAEPYIGIAAVFSAVIQPYTLGGAATTSATAVSTASAPTPTTLMLASADGFAPGAVACVDVDTRQERATVMAVSGSTITVQLSLEHVGTYPVVVESGESIIRDILVELRSVADQIGAARNRVGLQSVDEIEFFGGGRNATSQGIDPLTQLLALRNHWRDELASVLGVPRLDTNRGANASQY